MCDTPLEISYMLRETELRSRRLAAAYRTDEAAAAGLAVNGLAWFRRQWSRPFAVFGILQQKAN